ncbi:hypothetical protein HDU83_004330 [Entophlyctis luteolus]|nr:hypothetical protein HDU83_004330 [Entophlyctis luteolus]
MQQPLPSALGNGGTALSMAVGSSGLGNVGINAVAGPAPIGPGIMMDDFAASAAATSDPVRVYQLILDLTTSAPTAGPFSSHGAGSVGGAGGSGTATPSVTAAGVPDRREQALVELSKKRDAYEDLAPILWHSFGVMTALLQEIVIVYPMLSPPTLSNQSSNRVCNALALLQCVASHPDTRALFLNADIPLFLYPFLNTASKTRAFEYLRLTSLGVIGALVKNDNSEVAIFIVQKILLDEMGLAYICQTYERFYAVGTVLSQLVLQLVEQPSVRLLKHVVRCYLRLSDNPRAKEALRQCLPDPLRDNTFASILKDDLTTKRCLQHRAKGATLGIAEFTGRFRQQSVMSAADAPPGANTLEPPKLTSTGSSASLPAPNSLHRLASDGGSKIPTTEELEAFEAMVKERMRGHPYLPSLSQTDMRRFLVAHRNSPLHALKQLHTTLEWRASVNFNSILSEDFSDLEATRKLTIESTDVHQNAVMIWQQYRHHPATAAALTAGDASVNSSLDVTPRTKVASSSTMTSWKPDGKDTSAEAALEAQETATAAAAAVARNVRFFVYTIERAKLAHRVRPDNKITVIVDRLHMSPANYDQPLGKAILAVLPHYPDLFDAYYVFPRNALLMVAWKLTKVFLDSATVSKIHLLSEAEIPKILGEVVSKHELLTRYGGEKQDDAGHLFALSPNGTGATDGSTTPALQDDGDEVEDLTDAHQSRQSFGSIRTGDKKLSGLTGSAGSP